MHVCSVLWLHGLQPCQALLSMEFSRQGYWIGLPFPSPVQFSSVAQSCPTLRPHESQHARPPCPSPTPTVYSDSCPSSWWCHPAISSSVVPFSSCPQSPPTPQHQGLFQWVSSSHEVAKVFEFQFQHQFFQSTPELISFRMDWLYLLAVQQSLKSLLHHHSLKASILQHSVFFTVQLSHPYVTTGKTIALTMDLCRQSNVSAF